MAEKDPIDSNVRLEDADAALEFLKHEGEGGVVSFSEEDEKRLVRKIDWRIVPLMWSCYFLQYLDKTLINYAAVMNLKKDTNTSNTQFSYLAMAFYIYFLFEPPTGYLMQRLPTAKYLGANVILWGVIVTMHAPCKSFSALIAMRVLLGVFESAVAPSLILVTTMWYKKKEQPPRVGFWYMGVGAAQIFGAILSFAFQHIHSERFASWQILFLCCGLLTIVCGVLVVLYLPDNPMSCSFLTHDEKVWAIERLRENQTGIENKHFKRRQMFECLLDPQTWLISLLVTTSSVPNGAVSSFQATIIQNIGFSSEDTALLSIPSGTIAAVSTILAAYCGARYDMRGLFVIVCLALGVLGGSLLAFLPDGQNAGRLVGNYFTNFIGSNLPLVYSWAAANSAGHTKKVTMNAILLMSFCVGNIVGPLTFQGDDAPDYIPAKITVVVTLCVAISCAICLIWYYWHENKRRDAAAAMVDHIEDVEFLDYTDRENQTFRYRL